MAVTTGREVATGTLWISKSETEKVRVRVSARCGTPDCTYQGQLNIYEESSLGGTGNISEPTQVINLSHISDVSCLNTSHPTFLSSKDDEDIYPCHEPLWGFMMLLQTGVAIELFADTREQQQLWIKYLHLMSMFPFSPIPEEPRVNPIRDSYRSKIKHSNFDADSVWPVYILSEEVGSRIQVLGLQIVTLQSTLSSSKPARMTIISPLDNEGIVTWEANKMRRTGSLGNLVFIEIGRRCEGGPGLIWMYATPEDSISFRETVTRFLFNGDARPVGGSNTFTSLKGEPTYQYDRFNPKAPPMTPTIVTTSSSENSSPSSSGGSSFKLSFSMPIETPEKKKAEYDSAESDPTVYDYAFNNPFGPSADKKRNSLPISASPPPVNLGTHPSRNKVHKRSLSNPGVDPVVSKPHPPKIEIYNGPINSKYGGSKDSGLATLDGSSVNLEQDFSEIDKSLNDILSDLTSSTSGVVKEQEAGSLDDIIADLEELAKGDELKTKPPTPFIRRNTLPLCHDGQKPRRSNSTSTCHPIHYLEHKKMKRAITGQNSDEYITMKAISPLAKYKGANSTVGKGASRCVSYDGGVELSPIKEMTVVTSTDYENYPQPVDIQRGEMIDYKTPYENITSGGRGTESVATPPCDDDDIYENNEPLPLAPPTSSNPFFDSLVSSALDELDSLQIALEQIGS